jgi:hypothetical protein
MGWLPPGEVIEGGLTVTMDDETVLNPGAETFTTYWPVPVGVASVTVWTWLVAVLPAGIVTWVGLTPTIVDGSLLGVVGSVTENVTVSGLASTSLKQN